MIRVIVFGIICIATVMAETTVKPPHTHSTPDPSEHDVFKFVYEPRTHKMVLINTPTCYIFPLTDAERAVVHTDTGIAGLELKLLQSLTTATLTIPTEDQLNNFLKHACAGHITTYYMATI